MISRQPIIGVMGSQDQVWHEFATPLGKLIAQHDYHLLTGAGSGVMTAVAEAFTAIKNRKGRSIGIIPTTDYDGGFVDRDEFPNPYIEIPMLTPLDKKVQVDANPYSRNQVNIMSSSAVVLLPGDHGTQNEAALALHYKKQAILFGPKEKFAKFPQQISQTDNIEELREFLAQVRKKIRI